MAVETAEIHGAAWWEGLPDGWWRRGRRDAAGARRGRGAACRAAPCPCFFAALLSGVSPLLALLLRLCSAAVRGR